MDNEAKLIMLVIYSQSVHYKTYIIYQQVNFQGPLLRRMQNFYTELF